jgi:hypothetical protein
VRNRTLLGVVSPLLQLVRRPPPLAQKTRRVSPQAQAVRQGLLAAHEPDTLLELPLKIRTSLRIYRVNSFSVGEPG